MRLLHIQADGSFEFSEYTGDEIPAYAILSHRWGADEEEVTYKDIVTSSGKDKKGWRKIVQCARQAARDDLHYFWSDTCCIDKSSSAELTEALNSMWLWYRQSYICYAYLEDIIFNVDKDLLFESMKASPWFKRGWTLQELIAPANLSFYDSTWQPIGTRNELSDQVSEITGINQKYLCHNAASPHSASVAQRMSWASSRVTKRKEDVAYSLLGLFNVNMPMLYGEGIRAFQRLQEEIIRQSDDLSILAWDHADSNDGSYSGYLARSPADFSGCGQIVRSVNYAPGKPLVIANHRLYLEVPLLMRSTQLYARLNCRYENDFFCDIGMRVARWGRNDDLNDRGYRRKGNLRKIPVLGWENAGTYPIAVTAEPIGDPAGHDPSHNAFILRNLPDGYHISKVSPSNAWERATHTISTEASSLRTTTEATCNHRLVLLDNGHDHQFFIMMWHRKNLLFRDWTSEAAFLPREDASDMEQAHNHWKMRTDAKLPKLLLVDGQQMQLEVMPQLVRGERLTVVDITKTRLLSALRYKLLWLCKATGYRLRTLTHLFFEPQRFVEPWHDDTHFDQMRAFLWFPLFSVPIIIAQWIEYERSGILSQPWLVPINFSLLAAKRIWEVHSMRQTTWEERGRPDLVVAYSSRGNDAFDWDLVCFFGVFGLLPYVAYFVYSTWAIFTPLLAAMLFFKIGSIIYIISIFRRTFSEYPDVAERLSF